MGCESKESSSRSSFARVRQLSNCWTAVPFRDRGKPREQLKSSTNSLLFGVALYQENAGPDPTLGALGWDCKFEFTKAITA